MTHEHLELAQRACTAAGFLEPNVRLSADGSQLVAPGIFTIHERSQHSVSDYRIWLTCGGQSAELTGPFLDLRTGLGLVCGAYVAAVVIATLTAAQEDAHARPSH